MKKIVSYSLIVALAIGAASCGKSGDKKTELEALKKEQSELNKKISALEKELGAADTTKTERNYSVSVVAATPSVFNHYLELTGSVVADDEYFLNARAAGALTKVYIKVGDRVSAGQTVAEIDDAMLENQMAELQKRYELAKEVFDKQESLWKQNIGSEVQFLSAKNNKEALEKTMATLQKGREMYRIVAPNSGVVDECNLKVGAVVAPGVPLARIINFSKLKVKAEVPETYAGKIRSNNTVVVSFPDLKKDVNSKVGYIGNVVNPATRTFKVEVPLRPNEQGIIPNMASVIKVVDYSNPSAFVVPLNLIQKDLGANDFVFIEENGRAKKAIVKVGQSYGENIEILSGLRSGDKIITVGYQSINEGDIVKVQ